MGKAKYTVWLGQVIPANHEAMALERRMELLEIVKPSAEEWRNLTVVRAKTKPSGKLAPRGEDNQESPKSGDKENT